MKRGAEIREKHPLAGKDVKVISGSLKGSTYRVEDWWINVNNGVGWGEAVGNPACLMYAMRSGAEHLPYDDDVLYGKVGGLGHLVHVSELEKTDE